LATAITLPQKNLEAKDLDVNMLPHREVVRAYNDYGQEYERSCHDRAWQWFHALVTGKESIKSQEIEQTITNLTRLKDSRGEWLTYGIELKGKNWKNNKVDFFHTEGVIQGIPTFHQEIDPQTEQIIPETTTVEELRTIHTIPFTKAKIAELSPYFSENVSFIVKDKATGGKRYSCTKREFTELSYDELIDLKTGWAEYQRNRQRGQLK
jgi:hypothetical protein